MNWPVMGKKQMIVLLAMLAAVVLAMLYYLGYVELPKIKIPAKEKTRQELLNDFKADLTAGKLTNVNGVVAKVSGKEIALATVDASGAKKEQNITLTGNVLIRRLTVPEIKPGDKLTPMIETFITAKDLEIGDNVFVNINKNAEAVMLDVIVR